jgi:hypothetical protein
LEKVLERLGTTESTTIAVSRETNGKIRLTSQLWPEPKVILKGEVLEVRNVDGRLQVARKRMHHDDWNPALEPYDPYGPGQPTIDDGDIADESAAQTWP